MNDLDEIDTSIMKSRMKNDQQEKFKKLRFIFSEKIQILKMLLNDSTAELDSKINKKIV